MDFGPRNNTEREIEEVVKVAKRYKQEDVIETEPFDYLVLNESSYLRYKVFNFYNGFEIETYHNIMGQ